MKTKILVLGGYGNFGKLISKRLSKKPSIDLHIAGRSLEKAHEFLSTLENKKVNSIEVDINNEEILAKKLKELKPHTVINSCGPYNDLTYKIAKLCLEHDCNYIDLADSMDFVVGIDKINKEATLKGKVVISGASTVPGLSSIVVEHFKEQFDEIDSISISISPGNKQTFRGVATVSSVLSYCGVPFETLVNGKQVRIYGWQNLEMITIPGISNKRLVGNCKVPDIILFPKNYPSLKNFSFKAGTELKVLQLGTFFLSILKRIGIIPEVSKFAPTLDRISRWFSNFGSDEGGMNVDILGTKNNHKKEINWSIIGINGDGPQIPSTPAVVLIDKLIQNEIKPGAYPCWELFSLGDFMKSVEDFDIFEIHHHERNSISDPIIYSLGENHFKKLPEDIRKFHSKDGGTCGGNLKVTRGKGLLTNILCNIVGFPKENESCPITVTNEKGNWIRDFNGQILKSKWLSNPENGIIIEEFGFGKRLGLQLIPLKDGSGFYHITKKPIFSNLLPSFLQVSANGHTKGLHGGGWNVLVTIEMPLLGLLVKYEGDLFMK